MKYQDIKTVLSIAGSDSSGGAGIQADIKTILANGCYAMTALTAVTAQNTMGVSGIFEITPSFLRSQLDAVFSDIVPDAVKVGMVADAGLIEVIADFLSEHPVKYVVVDPVMVSTSGSRLLKEDAVATLQEKLFPLATVLTPNIPEAELLTGQEIHSKDDMMRVGTELYKKYDAAILVKGGHSVSDANDFLLEQGIGTWIYGEKIDNPNTHGTGCTLSSAIASNLAKGCSVYESVQFAKAYISGALSHGISLGNGCGPLNHGWNLKNEM